MAKISSATSQVLNSATFRAKCEVKDVGGPRRSTVFFDSLSRSVIAWHQQRDPLHDSALRLAVTLGKHSDPQRVGVIVNQFTSKKRKSAVRFIDKAEKYLMENDCATGLLAEKILQTMISGEVATHAQPEDRKLIANFVLRLLTEVRDFQGKAFTDGIALAFRVFNKFNLNKESFYHDYSQEMLELYQQATLNLPQVQKILSAFSGVNNDVVDSRFFDFIDNQLEGIEKLRGGCLHGLKDISPDKISAKFLTKVSKKIYFKQPSDIADCLYGLQQFDSEFHSEQDTGFAKRSALELILKKVTAVLPEFIEQMNSIDITNSLYGLLSFQDYKAGQVLANHFLEYFENEKLTSVNYLTRLKPLDFVLFRQLYSLYDLKVPEVILQGYYQSIAVEDLGGDARANFAKEFEQHVATELGGHHSSFIDGFELDVLFFDSQYNSEITDHVMKAVAQEETAYLAVELHGPKHFNQLSKRLLDYRVTKYFESRPRPVTILAYSNREVREDLSAVKQEVSNYCKLVGRSKIVQSERPHVIPEVPAVKLNWRDSMFLLIEFQGEKYLRTGNFHACIAEDFAEEVSSSLNIDIDIDLDLHYPEAGAMATNQGENQIIIQAGSASAGVLTDSECNQTIAMLSMLLPEARLRIQKEELD